MTVLRGARKHDGSVREIDRIMAVALSLYEDGLCEGCGQPRHISQSDAMVGAYEIKDQIVCHGCAAADEHRAGMANKVALPGQKSMVVIRPEAL